VVIVAALLFMYGARVFLTQRYQLFGKQTVYGSDARTAAIVFVLPFVAYLMTFAFGLTGSPTLINLANVLSYVFLGIAGALLGYTAFFAPDASLDRGHIELSDTVTTARAASYMNISEEEVLNLIHTGMLQARKVGSEYRIHKEVLIGYFQAREESIARDA
jgi:excisionase family DNA binding protein